MSFVIHVFESDTVKTVAQAADHVFGETKPNRNSKEKFVRFVADVTMTFPDLSDTDDASDNPNNIWSEGLGGGHVDEAIFNIGLKTASVSAEVLVDIAHAAARAGLHVLDPQNAMLYRSDRTMLAGSGVSAPLPPPEAGWQPKQKRERFEISAKEAALRLGEDFCRRAATHGYSMTRINPYVIQPMRSTGEVRQSVWFFVNIRNDETVLSGSFNISADRISNVWRTVLADRIANYGKDGGLCDFWLNAAEVSRQPKSDAPYDSGFTDVWTREEFDAWSDQFYIWYENDASAVMDRLNNLRSLGGVLLTEKRLEHAFSRKYLIHEQLSLLVLARALTLPTFDRWVDAMWDQYKRGVSHSWKQALNDPQAELLTKLVAFLRSKEFQFGTI